MASQQFLDAVFAVDSTRNRTTALKDGPTTRSSTSFAAIIATLIPTLVVALLQLTVFVIIRSWYRKIYSPRTYIGTVPEKDRTPSESRSRFSWFHTFRVIDDKFFLYHQSLDGYLYMRFLRTIVFICVVGCCLTWPILMPVNATGGGNSTQLDQLGIGNIAKKKKGHLYAHAVMAWVFFGFIMFLIARERIWLISVRQAWHLSKSNAKRLSSRTILFLSAPKETLNPDNLHRFFGDDAQRLWPATKADKLESLVSERNGKLSELESAEVSLTLKANKKATESRRKTDSRNGDQPSYDSLSDAVKRSLRPSHRLKSRQQVGKKVDTIETAREQLKAKEEEIEKARKSYDAPESDTGAAVFVEFNSQAAAQRAYRQVSHSQILALEPRHIGVTPKEVVWSNLTVPPAKRISEEYAAHAVVVAFILLFTPISTAVGAWSNVSYLADKFKFLGWINNLPDYVLGLLSGLVPPLATSLLSSYVPNIFRYVAKSFGEPTTPVAELKVQNWYFIFQVFQVFFVTSIGSAAASVVGKVTQEPGSVPQWLGEQIPKASNFYLTYFILQGTASAAQNVLNYSDLFQYLFYDYIFDKTPRQKYERYTQMKGIAWGKVFPKFTNFAVIAIVYACIQPLILGFAAAGLWLYYCSYRYNLLFVIQTKIDTKGHAYARALQQLLTGVYVAEICLIGLFGIRSATGPSVMTGILFILTIIYNYTMNRHLGPMEHVLPTNLSNSFEEEDESAPLLSAAEEGEANSQSRIQHLGTERAHIPKRVIDPVADFFEPRFFASQKKARAWLADGDFDDEDVPSYSEEDLKKAYLNPALTSKTPKIWLPKDRIGVSKQEVRENEEAGLSATDEGAWVDRKGIVGWDEDDFSKVPVFKVPVKY